MTQNKVTLRKLTALWKNNMRKMKVFCPVCEAAAVIRKSNRKHRELSDLYCACSDVECGHTFVLHLTFSHTLSPSAKIGDVMLQQMISSMSHEQKHMTLELLKAAPAA